MSLLFAGACSNLPIQGDKTPAGETTSAGAGNTQNIAETSTNKVAPKRPNLELTPDLLYKLLVAEIAGQRGKLAISVKNYLELAKSTRDYEIASRATRIAVYARDDKAAYEAASIWAELDPDNTDAHQVLAVMLIRQGDLDNAMKHFQIILNSSEGFLDQKLWVIASLLSKEENKETVQKVIDALMEDHQDNPDALYAYAHVMSRLDDNEKALQILQKLLGMVPGNVNATISYVSILQKVGRDKDAIEWLEKTLVDNKDSFELRMYYARLLTDEKRYDDARRQFEILATTNPDNIEVLYALGLLYLQANRLDESQSYFERMEKLEGRTDEAGYYLGRIAEEKGDFEKAIVWYQSVQQGNNYFDSQIRLGLLMAKQGKVDQARKQIQGIKTENDQQKIILTQAEAELLTEEKRYADAMEVYNRALAEDPEKPDLDLLYARAMLAEKIDRLDILEKDLKTILENDPENAQALNALGYTLADRTDRYQEAYTFIKRALEIKPDDFYILDSMGWVLYRLGRLDESIEYLHKALAERSDPEIAAHLGEVLWVKGDKAAAREIWEAALQQTPEDSTLLDVIKRFNP